MLFIFKNLHLKGDWKTQTFTSVLKISILCGFRHSVLSHRYLGKCLRLDMRQKDSQDYHQFRGDIPFPTGTVKPETQAQKGLASAHSLVPRWMTIGQQVEAPLPTSREYTPPEGHHP